MCIMPHFLRAQCADNLLANRPNANGASIAAGPTLAPVSGGVSPVRRGIGSGGSVTCRLAVLCHVAPACCTSLACPCGPAFPVPLPGAFVPPCPDRRAFACWSFHGLSFAPAPESIRFGSRWRATRSIFGFPATPRGGAVCFPMSLRASPPHRLV